MAVPLDLKRIAELGGLIGSDLEALLHSLEQSIERSIRELEQALAEEDLDRATYAAHACRNDALIVGAKPLLEALALVESHSRGLRLEPARDAFGRVRGMWPTVRAELERVAGRLESS